MANIAEHELHEANTRMKKRLSEGPYAVAAHYDRATGRIVIELDTGIEVSIPHRLAEGLSDAKPDELEEIELSPSGLGLHFPRLDADLYVPSLLQGVTGSKTWMAQQLGKMGGVATSAAKAAAARENGKRGGRPPKVSSPSTAQEGSGSKKAS